MLLGLTSLLSSASSRLQPTIKFNGEQYAQHLQQAGIPTTCGRYDGMIHGFVHFAGVCEAGRGTISDIAEVNRSTTATGVRDSPTN
ncbi:alpha/beta hydrolase [Aureliella helgolandensis]|uniref:alpha/beta hydrolase n=1 Tax=Aureliella helgolandensis TaxID=2527968 RepID=UPI0011A697C9|nr:alpha/beta hydrolase [Aureliella helgolandensis]